jgi:hypothetical protein
VKRVLLASASALAFGALAALATVPADLRFEPWFTSRGVSVEIARPSAGPPWIRGRAEVPAPASKVAAALSDFVRYKELFAPALKRADVLDRDGKAARLHLVWPYPFPFSNRDAVVRYETSELPDGGYRIAWRADARPGDPKEGVRIERVEGETRIEPADGSGGACRVTYVYLGDLGGKFPKSAEEKAWREEPVQYVRAVRRAVGLPDLPK